MIEGFLVDKFINPIYFTIHMSLVRMVRDAGLVLALAVGGCKQEPPKNQVQNAPEVVQTSEEKPSGPVVQPDFSRIIDLYVLQLEDLKSRAPDAPIELPKVDEKDPFMKLAVDTLKDLDHMARWLRQDSGRKYDLDILEADMKSIELFSDTTPKGMINALEYVNENFEPRFVKYVNASMEAVEKQRTWSAERFLERLLQDFDHTKSLEEHLALQGKIALLEEYAKKLAQTEQPKKFVEPGRDKCLQKILGDQYERFTEEKGKCFVNANSKYMVLFRELLPRIKNFTNEVNNFAEYARKNPSMFDKLNPETEVGGLVMKTANGYELLVYDDNRSDAKVVKWINELQENNLQSSPLIVEYAGERMLMEARGENKKGVEECISIFKKLCKGLSEEAVRGKLVDFLKLASRFNFDLSSVPLEKILSDNALFLFHTHPGGKEKAPSDQDILSSYLRFPQAVFALGKDGLTIYPYGLGQRYESIEVKRK